jgi:hypothetical protein
MAQEPTFSRVRSGSAQRSICRAVPFPMMALGVSPALTPRAVISPGQDRQISITGSILRASSCPASGCGPSRRFRGAGVSPRARASSRALARRSSASPRARPSSPIPKASKNFRSTS